MAHGQGQIVRRGKIHIERHEPKYGPWVGCNPLSGRKEGMSTRTGGGGEISMGEVDGLGGDGCEGTTMVKGPAVWAPREGTQGIVGGTLHGLKCGQGGTRGKGVTWRDHERSPRFKVQDIRRVRRDQQQPKDKKPGHRGQW